MAYHVQLRHTSYDFADLKSLMAKATPLRSGDQLAGLAAVSAQERVAAQMALAEVPLQAFLNEPLIAPEVDEVSRLIWETHDAGAFEPVRNFSVGEFRDWLLDYSTTTETLTKLAPGLTPEMVAAVSKIMANQDLILVGHKCRVVTKFRNTIGLPGRLGVRLQPNHPTDSPRGIAAAILDGLLMGCGDAVIGINPATDSVATLEFLIRMLDELIQAYEIPTQNCVLGHITTQIQAIERGAPVDLVFQSIAGTQAANASFGIDLKLLREGQEAALSLNRGTLGQNVMYFETGQGSCLSADAHHGVDQQTLEARAYAVARHFQPLLVNTVVGFIGPEYLYNGKQITRAALEDHFCGKLLGVPMGCDVCYTNHAEADQDDMDNLLVLLGAAGCNYIMGVPGADDVMLGYQSTSFHDAHFLRQTLGLRPAPEFEQWLERMGVVDKEARLQPLEKVAKRLGEGAPSASQSLIPAAPSAAVLRGEWGRYTDARLALPRAGASVATGERMDFQMAHANARDAVHWPFDGAALRAELEASGYKVLLLESDAGNREIYLQRPDLGRRLAPRSRAALEEWPRQDAPDVALIVTDGLSALAVQNHALEVLRVLVPGIHKQGWRLAPLCVVSNGRVALQDEIGAALGARMSLILIGERPGLGSPDSLGAYLVFNPKVGNTDANRNCISNIREAGLNPAMAAEKLLYLMTASFARGLSGVELKDESPAFPITGSEVPARFGNSPADPDSSV
jgi:ethanolamine ammonia-lyase large subunit